MAVARIDNIGGGGGIELVDVNPDNLTSGDNCYGFEFVKGTNWYAGNRINVGGYEKIKIYTNPSYYSNCKYKFQLSDGTFTAEFNATSGWSDYIDIPRNAVGLWGLNTGSATLLNYYSLYTDKQVIPTKVDGDINPSKLYDDFNSPYCILFPSNEYYGCRSSMSVQGFKKLGLKQGYQSFSSVNVNYLMKDGTTQSLGTGTADGAFTQYEIPNDAVLAVFSSPTVSWRCCWYYLLTK